MNARTGLLSLVLLATVAAPLSACEPESREIPQALFGTWVNSHEEDTKDYRVYRPNGFELPRSRGREGFSIESNGRFEMHRIARGNGIEPVLGRWELVTEGDVLIVRVFLEENQKEPLHLHIESLSRDKLVVHR